MGYEIIAILMGFRNVVLDAHLISPKSVLYTPVLQTYSTWSITLYKMTNDNVLFTIMTILQS